MAKKDILDTVAKGGTLVCVVCEAEQPCPAQQVVAYMKQSWPKHCDKTMKFVPEGD